MVEDALAIVLMVAWITNRYPTRRSGEVRADSAGISLDGTVVAARERIGVAYQLSMADPIVRMPAFDVRLEEDRAEELIEALGLGIGQSITSVGAIAGRWPWLPLLAWGILGVTSFVTMMEGAFQWGPVVMAASLVLLLAGHAAIVLSTKMAVDVGTDGVLVRRPMSNRFLRYGALRAVTTEGHAIALHLYSGEVLRFGLGFLGSPHLASRDALAARIEEARLACAEDRPSGEAEGFVAPGGRGLKRWVSEVRALARARDYREARVDAERLWSVLEDAKTSPAARAGAAIALSTDEGSRARLRVAADGCAEPRLRVALTRLAEGAAEPELEEALAPLLETEK
jgi:hypothetical protein